MWTQPYSFSSALDAMRGVPIPVWSTKSLCARWSGPTKAFPQGRAERRESISRRVAREYLRRSHWNSAFWPTVDPVYELGTIGPGEAARIGPMTKRTELKTLLTGRKVVFTAAGDKYQHESTPYDQSSTDLAYILRAMMFYDEAGGRRYTGLWNSYQTFVDMSDLLSRRIGRSW